jgi:hypothetical protein
LLLGYDLWLDILILETHSSPSSGEWTFLARKYLIWFVHIVLGSHFIPWSWLNTIMWRLIPRIETGGGCRFDPVLRLLLGWIGLDHKILKF